MTLFSRKDAKHAKKHLHVLFAFFAPLREIYGVLG